MDAPYIRWLSVWRKSFTAIAQECYELYWTNTGSNIPQNNSCTATDHPSRKPFKLDEQEVRTNCWRSKDELISDVLLWTPSHSVGRPTRNHLQQCWATNEKSSTTVLGDQREIIDNSPVRIQDVTWKSYRKRWMIEMNGKKGSEKSVLATRHDDITP